MPLDEMPLPKKRMRETGEKIYPVPEMLEDMDLNEFNTPIKDRAGTEVNMFDNRFVQDPDLTFPFYHPQAQLDETNRIIKEPFFTRQGLDKWGNGNLIVNTTRKLSYFNGKQLPVPINFYKGITRKKEEQFEELPVFKTTNYAEGTGMFFTTNLDDAHVAPNNTIPKLEEVKITKLQEIKNSRRVDTTKPSIVQVHIAPKKRLDLVTFKKDSTFIRDSKDYDKILAATRKLINNNDSKLGKDQKGLTITDFDRKLLEVGSNADDFMIRKANMTKDGEMFLSNDPYNPLPGQKHDQAEESWRWKFQHPDRRGQLNIEDLISFLPSSDFSDIAKAAGYTAAVIQYHPASKFMQEVPYDPNSFYEVVLYRT